MTINGLINQVTDAVEYGCRFIPAEEKDSIMVLLSEMAHVLRESNACGHALNIAIGCMDNPDADATDVNSFKELEIKGSERLFKTVPLPVFSGIMTHFMYAEEEDE